MAKQNEDRPRVKTGQKFCMSCMTPKSSEGGRDIVSPDKMRRRWVCKQCLKGQ